MIQKNKKSTKTSHNGQKDKVAINELKQSANKSKVQIIENTRNKNQEHTNGETLEVARVENTGWHQRRTWNELTKTWGRARTVYTNTN